MPVTWKFVIVVLLVLGLWEEYLRCPRNSAAGLVRDKRQQTRSYVREAGRVSVNLRKALARLAGLSDNVPLRTLKVILYSTIYRMYFIIVYWFMRYLTLDNPHIIYINKVFPSFRCLSYHRQL